MIKTESHDSRDSKRGDFYQPLVAIKYAISEAELVHFNKMTIEHHGDVSFDNLYQIETKHHKKSHSISDTSEDFWKTLYNWFRQKQVFNKLILHTTSHFPTRGQSLLKNWNKSSYKGKKSILEQIRFSYNLSDIETYRLTEQNIEILSNQGLNQSIIDKLNNNKNKKFSGTEFIQFTKSMNVSTDDKTLLEVECKDTSSSKYKVWNYSRYIKSCSEYKLKDIISKVIISSNQSIDSDLIIEISKTPVFKAKPCRNELDYEYLIKERLAGFIESRVVGEKRWEVTNQEFYKTINQAAKDFYKDSYIPVFDKYLTKKPNKVEIQNYTEKKFVKELCEMKCKPDELKEALVHYWKTNTLLSEESENNPMFVIDEYQPYKNEIIYPKLLNKKRTFKYSNDKTRNMEESLSFYRTAKELSIADYKRIQSLPYFTHGTMQNIVEDNTNNFNWLLDD